MAKLREASEFGSAHLADGRRNLEAHGQRHRGELVRVHSQHLCIAHGDVTTSTLSFLPRTCDHWETERCAELNLTTIINGESIMNDNGAASEPTTISMALPLRRLASAERCFRRVPIILTVPFSQPYTGCIQKRYFRAMCCQLVSFTAENNEQCQRYPSPF